MIKLLVWVKRRSHLTHDQFIEYWRTTHADLVLRSGITEHMCRYQQNSMASTTLVPSRFPDSFDGLVEVWFEDLSAFARMLNDPRYIGEVQPDESVFIDLENSVAFVTTEHVVFSLPQFGLPTAVPALR